MKQYPHFLFVRAVGSSTQDSEGNWVPASDTVALHSVCREETNGKGTTINGTDGKAIVYSSMVYLPRTALRIKEGTEVFVCETEDGLGIIRIKGQVLKFDANQLNARIWV